MVERAEARDYEELLAFVNKVFDKNFLDVEPKIYNSREKCADCHGIIRRNGKIIAAAAVCPSEFIIAGARLKSIGVGSVAVDENYRGLGLLSELMEFADSEAKRLGCEVGALSGYRMRYEHYGYTPCGIRYRFNISDYYCGRSKPRIKVNFEEMTPDAAEKCAEIYSLNRYRWQRDEENYRDVLRTKDSRPFSVVLGTEIIGSIVLSKDGETVLDLQLKNCSAASDVLVGFAEYIGAKSLCVLLPEHQTKLVAELSAFCEGFSIEATSSVKVFDYKSFLEKLIGYKLSKERLPDGELFLEIEDEDYKIDIRNSKVRVTREKGSPSLKMSRTFAARALTTYHTAQFLNSDILKTLSPLCPFSLSPIDEV